MSAMYEESAVISQELVVDLRLLPQSFIFYFPLIFFRRWIRYLSPLISTSPCNA
jgi:hypothetical protein